MVKTIGLNPLHLELMPDGRNARLFKNFRVKISDRQTVVVPKGFVTDFASVPRLFWRIVPPWGVYSPAAVVHDYLYHNGALSRKESDRIFLKLMKRLDVPLWKRTVMYLAVRLFGWSAWSNCRRNHND